MINNNLKYINYYQQLNNKQLLAVNNIDGPLLIISGPGTGKTQVIALRIGQILKKTDVLSSSILCITYTDVGTHAIRNRLLDCIGLEAYKVNIYTFHSLCNLIIRDNLDYWSNIELVPISKIEKINLLKSIIDDLPNDNILKRFSGDIYFDIYRLNNLFSNIKRENWNINEIINKIEMYISSDNHFINNWYYKNNYNNIKKLTSIGNIEKNRMYKLIEAINLYPIYIKKMFKYNRYDFDDMIIWTIDLFKNKPDILRYYQEKYNYILVDEYQDTSESQNYILNQLISYWDNPDICVVGDDDQSIFKFQGANIKNISNFIDKYKSFGLEIVYLNKNYRSNIHIINAASTLINNNKNRINKLYPNINKCLIAANNNIKSFKPVIREYNSINDELYDIANYINHLINVQNINPSDIAVIYRNHSLIENMLVFFNKKNIKFNIKYSNNILNVKIIKQIISILKYIDCEIKKPFSGEYLLFEILHFDFLSINTISIAKLRHYMSINKNIIFIRQIINKCEYNNDLKNILNKDEIILLSIFSNTLENLFKNILNITIQEIIDKILHEFNILKYILKSSDVENNINCVNSFISYVKELINRNPNITLSQFIDDINLMKRYKVDIAYEKYDNDDSINCLTAHSSKGKEFLYVFIISCNESYWNTKKNYNKNYKLPNYIFKNNNNIVNNNSIEEDDEEERRLFYVAITRAKEYLYISFSRKDINNKELLPSKFILELINCNKSVVYESKINNVIYKRNELLSCKKEKKIKYLNYDFTKKLVKNLTLNITSLNNYLKCPIKFYFYHLLNIPYIYSFNQLYGLSIHYSLKKFFNYMIINNKVFPSSEYLYKYFYQYMNINKQNFSDNLYNICLERGKKNLYSFYNYSINKWNKNVDIEKYIKNCFIFNIPLKGFIDKIEFLNDSDVNIVDYKTGSYKKVKFVRKEFCEPNNINKLGGNYWRQAIFYNILLENDINSNYNVVNTKFEFVEADNNIHHIEQINIQRDNVKIVVQQIVDSWNKIQNLEFIGCNLSECKWCNFIDENKIILL